MSTLQQFFDKGVCGVIGRGQLSRTHDFSGPVASCYRHPDDPSIRCVIGHCIPDGLYTPAMDKKRCSVRDLVENYPFSFACLRPHIEALTQLRAEHHNAKGLGDFKTRMRRFAASHGLTLPSCVGPAI